MAADPTGHEQAGSTQPTLAELRALVAEFQPDRGHVMPALHKVQDTYGYISRDAVEVIARQLNTTPALVWGTVSYYATITPTRRQRPRSPGAAAPPAASSVATASAKPCSRSSNSRSVAKATTIARRPPPRPVQRHLQRGAPDLGRRQGRGQPHRRLGHPPRARTEIRCTAKTAEAEARQP